MSRLNYLKQYKSRGTLKSYRAALKSFFEMVYGQREPLEDLAEKYFQEKRDYEEDVQAFHVSLKEYAPKSIRLKLSALRIFLIENGVELSQRFWRRQRGRVRGSRALTIDVVPSNKELRSIITHLPVQHKALFLSLSSSGMRIGECLSLTPKDVELDKDPSRVNLLGEYTKSGNPRVTFISKEAREAVLEWLKVRRDYLRAAAAKSHRYGKSKEDERLFPFEGNTAYVAWNRALKKTGNHVRDKATNIHKTHPHTLRKFFRTKLGAVIPVDVVEALMGHEGYLTEVYRRYSMDDLAKFYKQGESALLIFTEAEEVGKLRAEVEDRNRQLQTLVNGLTAENLELKSRVSRAEMEILKVIKKVEDLEKQLET